MFATLDRTDPAHAACRSLVEETTETLIVPAVILPEVDYLTARGRGTGGFIALLRDIVGRAYVVDDLQLDDYARVAEILDRYGDQDVGFVDAAVLATVERLGERRLATLDRRHFTILRPRHVDALELVP
jgi:uncharacterized protein